MNSECLQNIKLIEIKEKWSAHDDFHAHLDDTWKSSGMKILTEYQQETKNDHIDNIE